MQLDMLQVSHRFQLLFLHLWYDFRSDIYWITLIDIVIIIVLFEKELSYILFLSVAPIYNILLPLFLRLSIIYFFLMSVGFVIN